jgi:hypothetical protein
VEKLTQKSAAANFGRGSLPIKACNVNTKKCSSEAGDCAMRIPACLGSRRYTKSILACAISGSLVGSEKESIRPNPTA